MKIVETDKQRAKRILDQLREKYPNSKSYDRAIEVIISSKPHKHLKMTQNYTILKGTLRLHIGDDETTLKPGDKFVIKPNNIHWAESENECWLEIYSEPGWTKEDHIVV